MFDQMHIKSIGYIAILSEYKFQKDVTGLKPLLKSLQQHNKVIPIDSENVWSINERRSEEKKMLRIANVNPNGK